MQVLAAVYGGRERDGPLACCAPKGRQMKSMRSSVTG